MKTRVRDCLQASNQDVRDPSVHSLAVFVGLGVELIQSTFSCSVLNRAVCDQCEPEVRREQMLKLSDAL